MSNTSRMAVQYIAFAILPFAAGFSDAQQESLEIRRARGLVESEKDTILFFAHPTATYRSLRLDGVKQLTDGFSLAYRTMTRKMNLALQENRRERVERQRRSGVTLAWFSRREGVSPSNFYR